MSLSIDIPRKLYDALEMKPMRKLVSIFVLTLFLTALVSVIPPIQAQGSYPILIERGPNYVIKDLGGGGGPRRDIPDTQKGE